MVQPRKGSVPKFLLNVFTELCKGNVYTTTIWVINSAIIKLKTLTVAHKVYRGLKGLRLPDAFMKVNTDNVRGGVESGFMSCSLDKKVAMAYASDNRKSSDQPGGIVFEIQQGQIDRGCDLSWLSQCALTLEAAVSPHPRSGSEPSPSRIPCPCNGPASNARSLT